MRWAKTAGNTILTIAVILVVLLGAGYIALALYDWNNLKPRISKALEDATGRKTTIQGDVTLELDLSPTLGINDIKIQNADWGANPTLMTIPHAELEIDLFSLLDQRTEIQRIYLKQPAIHLETNEKGELNIQPPEKEKKDQQPSNFFRKVKIENGDFSYQDHTLNKSYQGKLKTFTAQADSFDSSVRVDAVGTYLDKDFSIYGKAGSQAGLLTEENAWRVDLKAKLGDAQAKADGIIPVNSTAETGTLNISAEGDNLSELAALFGVSVPAEKPFQVSGKIAPDPRTDRWQVTGDARLGDMAFEADGNVAELTSLTGVKAEISAEGPNLSEVTALFGKSVSIDKSFEIKGNIFQSMDADRWQVDAEGTLGEMDVSMNGSLPQFTSVAGLKTDISVEGPDYSNLMALFGVSVTVDSPFDLNGDFQYPDPDQPMEGKINGTIGEMALDIDGSIPQISKIEGLKTTVSAEGPDFSKLMAVFMLEVPMFQPFDVTTDFSYPDTMTYHLDKTNAEIGDSDFTGRIQIDAAAKPFAFLVDVTSEHLDLAAFIDNYSKENGENAQTGNANEEKDQLIPDRPLPLDILKSYNSEIHLKADTLLLPRLSLTEFRIDTTLEGGHLNIDTLQSKIGTGAINGRMEVQSQANPPLITAVLNADSIQLDEMVRGKDPAPKIKGNMNINLDISGSGKTYAELAADLSGKAGLEMSDGRLYNQYMRLLGKNIFSALIDTLNPFDKKREYVDINCMVTRFEIEDGLAESMALVLDTPEVAIVGEGKINLKTEEIEIPLNTISKKNLGIKDVAGINLSLNKFVDPLQIDGTLSKPNVRVDVSGALFSIGKAVGGVALFGPAGIAATLLSGSAGKQNICQAALEKGEQPNDQKGVSEKRPKNSKAPVNRSNKQGAEQPISLKDLKVQSKESP